jgi:hypothetical protein
MYRNPATNLCSPCSGGKFMSNSSSATDCDTCPIGKYALLGYHNCFNCNLGAFTNRTGMSRCELCSRGSFSNTTGASQCTQCPDKTYAVNQGASSFQDCTSDVCPLGYFSLLNGTCLQCPAGFYSNNTFLSSCYSCIPGFFSESSGLSTCRTCPEGTYMNMTAGSSCFPCQLHRAIFCPPGSVIPLVGAGLYRSSTNPTIILECSPPEACAGAGNGTTRCSEGYEGFLCQECVVEWFRSGSKCLKCMPKALRRAILGISFLVFAIALSRWAKVQITVPVGVKVTLYWFQFISFYSSLSSSWPPSLSWIFKVGDVMNFDIGFIGASCEAALSTYYNLAKFKIVLPIAVFMLILVLNVLVRFATRRTCSSQLFDWSLRQALAEFLFLICFFSMQLSSSMLSLFNCVQIAGEYRLAVEPAVVCYDSTWKSNLGLHIFFILFYSAMYPGITLVDWIRLGATGDESQAQKTIGKLVVTSYKPGIEWFEVYRQYHRFAFVLVKTVFRISNPGKATALIFLLMALQFIECKYRPYKVEIQNDLSQL